MDLQELVTIWNSADQALEKKLKINQTLFKEVSVNKIRSMLGEFKWTQFIEISMNAVFLIYLIGFFIDYFSILKFSVSAVALICLMIYGLGFNIYMLKLFYRINVGSSVIQTQRIIEKVRYYQAVYTKMLYVNIPLFSAPFLIVLAKGIFDFDVFILGNWLYYYVAVSFIIALIVVYFLKRFPDRNVEKALSFLREIRDFEKDESKG
jgi:hypothetical protein